ncbi:MAG TPA: CDP-glycerol glycerophosphotransferase family protein, partial [Brevibacterium sp.]|nr:CDP-glycerol glycerophosphotransferase family protein [Brevibacterium sp.]
TDHSSVHFDAAYLGTPVIYARFDRDEYESRHAAPSWFDYERDGFGPVTYSLDGALDELEALLTRDCEPDPRYAARVSDIFTHHDFDNSRRVVAAIDDRLRAQRS